MLFANLPLQLEIPAINLETFFTLPTNRLVSLVTGPLRFDGTIQSVTPKNDNTVTTVIIQSVNRNGSFLTLTKFIHEDGSVSYSGKILSFQHGDCFVLQKKNELSYLLIKKKYYEVVSD
jgi:hypothetical protein